jgi:hypothetical protein
LQRRGGRLGDRLQRGGGGLHFEAQAIGERGDGVRRTLGRILGRRLQGRGGGLHLGAQAFGQAGDRFGRTGGRRLQRGAQRGGGRLDLGAELAGQRADRAHRTGGAGVDRGQQVLAAARHQAHQGVRLPIEGLRGALADAGDIVRDFAAARRELRQEVCAPDVDQRPHFVDLARQRLIELPAAALDRLADRLTVRVDGLVEDFLVLGNDASDPVGMGADKAVQRRRMRREPLRNLQAALVQIG